MLVYVKGAKCIGIEAVPVTVEVDISPGIGIHLVGLADAAVKESLLRTITALKSVGYRIPGKKIVINLAPADMHKKGSGYDLPIAVGIIAASGQMELPLLDSFIVMGELGLDGSVRNIPGALPIAELAVQCGVQGCVLPWESAMEASGYDRAVLYGVRNLEDVLRILSGQPCGDLIVGEDQANRLGAGAASCRRKDNVMDFSEIVGQETAKRGL
ncbi:MAG: magnesium chelatase domain-containing protein, partial [Candidatus Cryptobacteroides sp.]